jgi:Ser/Thr protein kinase RdoA (MazF antagonist)
MNDTAPDEVLRAYGLSSRQNPMPVGVGTLNSNWRVETDAGAYFLRRHRSDISKERVQEEHALLAWVAARGIPVACPIATAAHTTVIDLDGALWALFPWIPGAPPDRGALTTGQARAAGEMHGRLHRVPSEYCGPERPAARLEFNTETSIEQLDSIIDRATTQHADDWILEGLRWQLELLRRHGHSMPTPAELRTGLSHGDYHDQQLLFDEREQLVAVTDWEMFGVRPLVYEVIRSLWFSQLMEGPSMEAYVAAYRTQVQLTAAECRLGMGFWWQGRLHATWVFEELFLRANGRVAGLLPESFRVLHVLEDEDARANLTERFVRAASG